MRNVDMRAVGITGPETMVDSHFESSVQYWDRIYDANDVGSVIYQRRQDAVLELIDDLKIRAGSHVLEIGCGTGRLAAGLAHRGLWVDALDRADAMIEMASNRALREGVSNRLTIGWGDVNKLEAASGTYDLVIAVGVLPWLSSLDAPLREMARVTRPGGSVLVTVDNRWALHRLLEPRINPALMPLKHELLQMFASVGLISAKAQAKTWSVKETDYALARAGLTKKRGLTLGFGPFTIWKHEVVSGPRGILLHERLQGLAKRGWSGLRSAGAHYIVLASKGGGSE